MISIVKGHPWDDAPRVYVNLRLSEGVPDETAVVLAVTRELTEKRQELEKALESESDQAPVYFRTAFPIMGRTFVAWMALSRLLLADAPHAARALVSMARNHGEDQARAIMKTLQAEGWIGAFGGRPARPTQKDLERGIDFTAWPKSGDLKL